jgi:dTDP-glucose 4,6-dehydratase
MVDWNLDPMMGADLDDMPVLVTGGTGFIGSHLVDCLLAHNANVHLIVRPTSRPPGRLKMSILEKVQIHWANLVDPFSVRAAAKAFSEVASSRRALVFHLGAQAHVGESWARPMETFLDNTIGTLNLLQALIDVRVPILAVDIAGTSEEYGNVDPQMMAHYTFREGRVIWGPDSPVNPQSPYATSKMAADYLGRNFFVGYGLPVVVTRMFNNFGPRQSPRFLTGTVITQALSREKVVIGNPDATRDYTYVIDGVRGHIYAALRGVPGSAYAFGYGSDISSLDWAQLILDVGEEAGMWRAREVVIDRSRYRPGQSEVRLLGVDNTGFEAQTGWTRTWDRRSALKSTIEFYRENLVEWTGQLDWR